MFGFLKKQPKEELRSCRMGWRVLTYQDGKNWVSLQIEPMVSSPCRVYVPSDAAWQANAPAWAKVLKSEILTHAKSILWNRDLEWIESDRALFWPRHITDPPYGSLESTDAGKHLENLRLFHPDSPQKIPKDSVKKVWCAVILKFIETASGVVTIDASEIVKGSVFADFELELLRSNPNVTLKFVEGKVRSM